MSQTASTSPTSTYMTYLLYSESGTEGSYKKLIDIKESPDKGGDPEMIDVTTLSDDMTKNIPGIKKADGMSYPANYTVADYTRVKALEGKDLHFIEALGGEFDSNGNLTAAGYEGANYFQGKLSAYMTGGGVNAARGINITIGVTSKIEFKAGSVTLATE